MTSQPNSPNFGTWGNSYASFLLGAVGTSLADIQPTWGARFIRYGLFIQDEWRATRNLSISYGLRWDYNPPMSEVQGKISSFQPYLANPAAGGRLGALAFIGDGPGRIGGNFQDRWKKGFGPRSGHHLSVERQDSDPGLGGHQRMLRPAIARSLLRPVSRTPRRSVRPDGYTPLYYLNSGHVPANIPASAGARPVVLQRTGHQLHSRALARVFRRR